MRIQDLDTLQAGDLLQYAYMPDNRLFGPVSRVYRVIRSERTYLSLVEIKRLPGNTSHYLNTGSYVVLDDFRYMSVDGTATPSTLETYLPYLSKLDSSFTSRVTVGA